MEEKNGIITVLQSIQEYKEKVGSDGLLELPFTAEEKYLTDAEANPVRFSIQVSRKVKDPNDDKKEVYVFEDDQLAEMPYPNASLVRSPDMKTVGIKAIKQDETPFSKEEKLALRKQLICFKNTALIVEKGILTEEAIENCTVPVVVDLEMAELIKGKSCYCNKDLTEEEVKAIIKIIKGSETIFGHADCTIKDKSIANFTLALNTTFRKYNISSCIQKITFLAQSFHESDNFNTAEEYSSNHDSSKSFYKGRGLIQMTGVQGVGSLLYNEPGPYKTYAEYVGNKEIINKPELIAQELTYAVDSAGWLWSKIKKTTTFPVLDKFTETQKSNARWKSEYFKDGLKKTLNELATVMENVDEDKYFYLQSKILNGYSIDHKLEKDPNGWSDRKSTLSKLKTWFKYDKNICNSGGIIPELSGRAPWLVIAMQEFEKYKGLREIDSPLKEKVHEYFKVSSTRSQKADETPWNYTDAWCGAFLAWCFEQTEEFKKINTAYSAQAFGWKSDKWSKGEDSVPFVGALIVFDFSHVALIAGENIDGTAYVYLGGNQGNGEKRTGYQKIILGSVPKNSASILGITKPKKYIITEEDKKFPKYDINAENSKDSSR
ncbi:hypothetical protein [Flavobacterium geliluteum]|uniref:TIGR02594 family protein n=1 Tax=Flavobacterium geliluteum TaxID=2816120 RepID=A0A941B1T0_9FLAO|nr:hypothetical protein [Flavobacterium geliluteum]MBP4136753.1 hypothetical protein [Flavobacterium geliluteum]